jgi:hypothetical protein
VGAFIDSPGARPGEALDPGKLLARWQQHGDPAADAVAASLAAHGADGGELDVRDMAAIVTRIPRMDQAFLQDLRGRDPHIAEALDAFLAATESLPAWHSDPEIEAGNRLFEDNAVLGFVVLGCRSLLECYCWQVEAEALGMTQGLQTHINRRIPETAQFVLDVMGDRAILHRDHDHRLHAIHQEGENMPDGVLTIQKVRLMHALMRWLIEHDPEDARRVLDDAVTHPMHLMAVRSWPKKNGPPISQAFMAGTLTTFSLVILEGFRRMGVPVSEKESRDFLHLWRVVGFKMGVDEELLAWFEDEDRARRLHEAMMRRYRAVSEPGPRLAIALENYMKENIVDRVPFHRLLGFQHMPRIVMWNLCQRETALVVGMKPGWFGRIFGGLAFQGLRFVGWLGRYPLFRGLSDGIFDLLARVMWGWRRSDEPARPAAPAKTARAADEAAPGPGTAAVATEPRKRDWVIEADVADRMGIGRRRGAPSAR